MSLRLPNTIQDQKSQMIPLTNLIPRQQMQNLTLLKFNLGNIIQQLSNLRSGNHVIDVRALTDQVIMLSDLQELVRCVNDEYRPNLRIHHGE